MKTRNHNSWTTRASGLETGTSVLVFFKERIQQREGSETTKAFIKKKKKRYVWKDTGVGESRALGGGLNCLYGSVFRIPSSQSCFILLGVHICLQCRTPVFDPWVEKIPWRREWLPTPCSCLENPMDRGKAMGLQRGRHN